VGCVVLMWRSLGGGKRLLLDHGSSAAVVS
jgi:hypothetical protein